MRRAMLTVRPGGLPPFIMGDPAVSGTTAPSGGYAWVNQDNPAPRAGVVTSVDIYATTGGACHIFTCTASGSTLTYTSVVSKTLSLGANTVATSLAVNSGGYIGVWFGSSGSAGGAYSGTTGALYFAATSTTPAPGGIVAGYGPAGAPGKLSLQGTGS